MRYIIYCDESENKGRYYSNFYGGALIAASMRETVENALESIKTDENIHGEIKWTKTAIAYEEKYKKFIDTFFEFVKSDKIKVRIMFTQNINQRPIAHDLESGNEYFILYYHFLKHAFGLRYANPDMLEDLQLTVMMDDVPQKIEEFENFKEYLESLSKFPLFRRNRIIFSKSEISGVDSKKHNILQAVDYILGAMQFRLNDKHKIKKDGEYRRGKRTISKHQMYKHVYSHIRSIYPNFNIGVSTGTAHDITNRWTHQYRHWVFVPSGSVQLLSRGKNRK